MPRIEACQNATFVLDLFNQNVCSFDIPFSLGFQPDEVIVRNITANGSAEADALFHDYNVYTIHCDVLNNVTLGTFTGFGRVDAPQSYVSCPQTVFKINKPISGTTSIHIDIYDSTGSIASLVDRILTVSIDFIKYREKPKKK